MPPKIVKSDHKRGEASTDMRRWRNRYKIYYSRAFVCMCSLPKSYIGHMLDITPDGWRDGQLDQNDCEKLNQNHDLIRSWCLRTE